jgi:hypothetical protein
MRWFVQWILFSLILGHVEFVSANSCYAVLNSALGSQDIIQHRWDQLSENDQFSKLLMMLGSNGSIQFSRKDIFEKGEMELGIPFGMLDVAASNERTLVLTYQGDGRRSQTNMLRQEDVTVFTSYKLTEISILDRAAEREKIDGRPLDPATLRLSPKAIEQLQKIFGDRHLDSNQTVSFPSVISGRLVTRLNRSEGWIEHIRPDEMASLKLGGYEFRRLQLSGQLRRLQEFLFRMLPKKIVWKSIEWGAMFGVLSLAMPAQPVQHIAQHQAQQVVVMNQIAQHARTDLAQIVRQNTMIVESEKTAIFEAMFRENAAPVVVDSPFTASANQELRTTNGRDLWIFNKDTGRIFLTTVFQQQAGQGVQLMAPVTIEIPRQAAPQTYQAIFNFFQRAL